MLTTKLHCVFRGYYVDVEKLRKKMNAFIIFQFGYCSFVWMFHDRLLNKKINKIHERALRIAYKDSCSNFEELSTKANSVTIHKNLQLLAIEIFKSQKESPFKFYESYLFGEGYSIHPSWWKKYFDTTTKHDKVWY